MAKSVQDRFWAKVKKTDNCWEWIGAKNQDGYGNCGLINGIWERSHRLSWKLHFGDIPEGMLVCHHCDNPSCVRPDHLFLGNHHDNLQDSYNKGRPLQGLGLSLPGQGYQNRLTWADVHAIRESQEKRSLLATKFGVSLRMIFLIRANKRWRVPCAL